MNRLLFLFLALALIAGCTADPAAGDFAAPRLGVVTVEAEAFQAQISCPVEGGTAGVVTFGFRFGKDVLREIPATLADGRLTATVKGLRADTRYQVEAFLGNGGETIASERMEFRTDEGPEVVDIPDPAFRRFILKNFDENHDDVFTVSEAQKITILTVCTDSIYSLKGIEKMSRLTSLVANGTQWGNGHLTEIDLSGNPLLEYCQLESNLLHTVDISNNPLLWNFSACVNPLDSIDFSHNPLLTAIGLNGTNLTSIPVISSLRLGSLHMGGVARYMPGDYLRQFPELYACNIGDFMGSTLDLSQNPYLNAFWCENAPYIEEIDLTATIRPNIEHLHVCGCPRLRRVLVRAGTKIEILEKDDRTEIVYIEQ